MSEQLWNDERIDEYIERTVLLEREVTPDVSDRIRMYVRAVIRVIRDDYENTLKEVNCDKRTGEFFRRKIWPFRRTD